MPLPDPFNPGKETWYSSYRRWGGTLGHSGWIPSNLQWVAVA